MDITIVELGARFKLLRIKAKLSQDALAERLNTSQNIISRIENGEGGSLKIVLGMVNFYRTIFNIDTFFATNFHIDPLGPPSVTPLQGVAIERLLMLRQETNKELAEIIRLLKG